jgi:thioredoxin reductase
MYDVVIVGAGPAGLSAALLLGRARRRTLLCDTGMPRNSVSHAAHGFLTRDGTDPTEIRQISREQLTQYDSVECWDELVTGATARDGHFEVSLAESARVTARRLLIAAGMRDELPHIEGLTDLWGRGTFPCPYCDGWEVRDQPLVVLGAGMPGALFALLLSKWSPELVLCTHGSSDLEAQPRALLQAHGIDIREDEILRINRWDDGVEVVFAGGESLRRRALFVHPTLRQATDLPARLGCAMTEEGAIQVSALGETSVPGVFAAGDAVHPEGLPSPAPQLIMAAAQGATAAIALDRELLLEDLGLPREVLSGAAR